MGNEKLQRVYNQLAQVLIAENVFLNLYVTSTAVGVRLIDSETGAVLDWERGELDVPATKSETGH